MVLKEETDTIGGILIQDPHMLAFFDWFPEMFLMDATHKTNIQERPLHTLLTMDENGESHVAASFLVQKEDKTSLRKMLQMFKESNPKWKGRTDICCLSCGHMKCAGLKRPPKFCYCKKCK